MQDIRNIFDLIPEHIPEELIQDIIDTDYVKIERIVSRGHASPEGFWYDQKLNEWVILLKGSSGIQFEGGGERIQLKPGDYLNIPSHTRHRVLWTDPHHDTVWLAIHY